MPTLSFAAKGFGALRTVYGAAPPLADFLGWNSGMETKVPLQGAGLSPANRKHTANSFAAKD
jgi:hypothetical protein